MMNLNKLNRAMAGLSEALGEAKTYTKGLEAVRKLAYKHNGDILDSSGEDYLFGFSDEVDGDGFEKEVKAKGVPDAHSQATEGSMYVWLPRDQVDGFGESLGEDEWAHKVSAGAIPKNYSKIFSGDRDRAQEIMVTLRDDHGISSSYIPRPGETSVYVAPDDAERALGVVSARDEGYDKRGAPTGEDLTAAIWREIGEWLERGEEFELGDINRTIRQGSRGEKGILESNIGFIVRRELEKKFGRMTAKDVTVEIEPSGFESSPDEGDNPYRAIGSFRIWHDEDGAAEGSFAAEGFGGDLNSMTINITQASGHAKHNPPIQFFG